MADLHFIETTQSSHGRYAALCSCGRVVEARDVQALARKVVEHLGIPRRKPLKK